MAKKKLLFLLCILLLSELYSQGGKVGIDTSSPHQKTVLDIVSKTSNTGVLFPRLTTSNIASINPTVGDAIVDGLWVYNTDTKCYNYWAAAPQNQWMEICGVPINGDVSGSAMLNCTGASSTGTLVSGQPANGVSFTIPYTAGNGGPYTAQSIASSGVSGLTANIAASSFNNGTGNLTYTVSGTPASVGTASFIVNIGGSTCTINFTVMGGFDLSKLKILALGASPYSVDAGTNGGLGNAMYSSNNFGPSGTIKTISNWNVTRRNVTSGGVSDLNTGGYKMLIAGYAYDVANSNDANIIVNFINNGGTVLWFTETRGKYTLQLLNSFVTGPVTLGDWSDCSAVNSSTDGSLIGDFGDARGKVFGNDACIARDLRGSYDANSIDILSRSVATNNPVAFKSKTAEFYWFGDGGMSVYIGSAPPVKSNSYPWLLDSSQRPVIGQWGIPVLSNVSNSIMLMNIIAKALKNAQ